MASERNAARAPELSPVNYQETYGEFIGVGPNGNLWVDAGNSAMRFENTTRANRKYCSPTNRITGWPIATS